MFYEALPLAMAGLRAATARVDDACAADVQGDDEPVLARALIETLWWQKSVEDLWEEELGEAFYRRRDASDGGVAVGGLAYARNVGGHRVGRTYDEVVYRAASTVESVTLASMGAGARDAGARDAADGDPRWPRLSDLPPLPMEDPFDRARMYSDRVADRPLPEPLHAALGFFEELSGG